MKRLDEDEEKKMIAFFVVMALAGGGMLAYAFTQLPRSPEVKPDWQEATCEIRAASLFAWAGGVASTRSKGSKQFDTWLMQTYYVTLTTPTTTPVHNASIDVPVACEDFDEVLRLCKVVSAGSDKVNSATKSHLGGDEDDVGGESGWTFSRLAALVGRDSFLTCECETCAVSQDFCSPIPPPAGSLGSPDSAAYSAEYRQWEFSGTKPSCCIPDTRQSRCNDISGNNCKGPCTTERKFWSRQDFPQCGSSRDCGSELFAFRCVLNKGPGNDTITAELPSEGLEDGVCDLSTCTGGVTAGSKSLTRICWYDANSKWGPYMPVEFVYSGPDGEGGSGMKFGVILLFIAGGLGSLLGGFGSVFLLHNKFCSAEKI